MLATHTCSNMHAVYFSSFKSYRAFWLFCSPIGYISIFTCTHNLTRHSMSDPGAAPNMHNMKSLVRQTRHFFVFSVYCFVLSIVY